MRKMEPTFVIQEFLDEALFYMNDLSSESRSIADKLLQLKQSQNIGQEVSRSQAISIRDRVLQALVNISSVNCLVPNVSVTPAVRNASVKPAVQYEYVTPPVPWIGEETISLDLTYVRGEDPWDFVLTCANGETRDSITSFLQERDANGELKKLTTRPVVGSFIVYSHFRGVVDFVHNTSLRIMKVDYGDEVVVPQDDLFHLPEEIAKIPCQSFKCRLLYNDEFLKISWCDKLKATFKDLLTSSVLLVDVDLLISNGLPPFFVKMYAYNGNRAPADVSVNSWVNMVINKLKMKPPDQDLFSFVIPSDIILNPFLCGGDVDEYESTVPSLVKEFGLPGLALNGKCVSKPLTTFPTNILKSTSRQHPKPDSKAVSNYKELHNCLRASTSEQLPDSDGSEDSEDSKLLREKVTTWLATGRLIADVPKFKERERKFSPIEPTFYRPSQRKDDAEVNSLISSMKELGGTGRNVIPLSFTSQSYDKKSFVYPHPSSWLLPHFEEPKLCSPSPGHSNDAGVQPLPSSDQHLERHRHAITLTNPAQSESPSSGVPSFDNRLFVYPDSSSALLQDFEQPKMCSPRPSQSNEAGVQPSPSSDQHQEKHRNAIIPTNPARSESPSSGVPSFDKKSFVYPDSSSALLQHFKEPKLCNPRLGQSNEAGVRLAPSSDQDQEKHRNAIILTNPAQSESPSSGVPSYDRKLFLHPDSSSALLLQHFDEPKMCNPRADQSYEAGVQPAPSSDQDQEKHMNAIALTNPAQSESPSSGMPSYDKKLFVYPDSSSALLQHFEEPKMCNPRLGQSNEAGVQPAPSSDQDQETHMNAITFTNPAQPESPSSGFIHQRFLIVKQFVVEPKPTHNHDSGCQFMQRDVIFNVNEDTEEIDQSDGIIANLEEEYMPTDERRICQFFRKNGYCKRWNCGREHEAKTSAVWTTDREEIYSKAFNALELPTAGSFESLTVQHVLNSIEFYATLPKKYSKTDEPVLETTANLHADLNSLESNNTHPLLSTAPLISELVLALGLQPSLGPRRKWLRAVVVETIDEFHVEVFFVDFGNNDILKLKDLRKIRPRFLHLPFQAVLTTLAHLAPQRDPTIKEDACKFLRKNLTGKTLRAQIVESDRYNTILGVILLGDDGNCINAMMLQCGLALPFNL